MLCFRLKETLLFEVYDTTALKLPLGENQAVAEIDVRSLPSTPLSTKTLGQLMEHPQCSNSSNHPADDGIMKTTSGPRDFRSSHDFRGASQPSIIPSVNSVLLRSPAPTSVQHSDSPHEVFYILTASPQIIDDSTIPRTGIFVWRLAQAALPITLPKACP
jgi:hypothetical protein